MAKKFLTDIDIAGGIYDSSGDIGSSGQVLSSTGSGLNWIDSTASSSVIYQDAFSGNGSATAFTLANSVDNENKTQVYIDGVYQFKNTYSISGTTLTFSTAPPNNTDIEVISFNSITADGDILTDSEFGSAGLMTTNGSGVYSITTNNSSNWNTAYTYSQVGHLPLAGGAITGAITTNSTFDGRDVSVDGTKLDGIEANADVTDTTNVTAAGALMDSELTDLAGVKAVTISNLATVTYVDSEVAGLVDSSPATLNTLNELAAALGDDPNFATTTANSIGTKMPLAGGTFTGNISGVRAFFNSGATNVVATFTSTDGTATLQCADSSGNVEFGASGNNFVVQPAGGVAQLTVGSSLSTFAGTVETTTLRTDVVNNKANSANIIYRSGTSTLVGGGTTANKLYVLDSGNIGIGTASPTSKLSISGSQAAIDITRGNSGDSKWEFSSDSTALYFSEMSTGTRAYMMTIKETTGNVGIGITNPQSNLHVFLDGTSGETAHFGSHSNVNASGQYCGISLGYRENNALTYSKVKIVAEGVGDGAARQNLHFLVDTANDGNSAVLGDSKMSIQYNTGDVIINNKLGIGTTSPGSKLEVITSGANSVVELDNSNTNYTLIQYNASGATKGFSGFNAGFMLFGGESGTTTRLQSGGSYAATILENGNFGIGTTSPSEKLTVNGNIESLNTIILKNSGGHKWQQLFQNTNDFVIRYNNTSTWSEKLRINSSGNATFAGEITSGDDINAGGKLVCANVASDKKIAFRRTGANNFSIEHDTSSLYFYNETTTELPIRFFNNGDVSMIAGNVGIGTTSPNYKLTVADSTANGRAIQAVQSATSGTNWGFQGGAYGSGASKNIGLQVTAEGASTNYAALFEGGNVGIGTTSPTSTLSVQGTTNNGINVIGVGTTANRCYVGLNASNHGQLFCTGSSGQSPSLISSAGADSYISGGNVGIGTTSPAARLHVENTNAAIVYVKSTVNNQNASIWFNSNSGGTQADRWEIGTNISAGTDLEFFDRLNSVSRMVIQNDGNVGIGTISPSSYNSRGRNLVLSGSGDVGISIDCSSANSGTLLFADGTGGTAGYRGSIQYEHATDHMAISTAATERMRITSDGIVGIGDLNPTLATRLVIAASSGSGNVCDIRTGTTANTNVGAIVFRNSASAYCGQITVNGATGVTSYLSASDYRLKEDLKDFKGLDLVSNIKVYDYKWKSADERTYGAVAHELQEVLPQAVNGNKDDEQMQSVDYSKIVPLLVKSIQELKAEIELLKTQINN